MNVRILFDSKRIDKKYKTGWGFSCLVGGNVLFDTGPDYASLRFNMEKSGLNPEAISAIVISHEHDDHSGGLWKANNSIRNARVIHCPNSSNRCLKRIQELQGVNVPVREGMIISEGVFSTGEMIGAHNGQRIMEQALIIKGKKGIGIITGCAHPGLLFVVRHVKNLFQNEPIHFLIGGFHLKDYKEPEIRKTCTELEAEGVGHIAAGHCTGSKALKIFAEHFGLNFLPLKTGMEINI